jgi:putative nucleotidyltransferase with HDIG domain
MEALNKSLDTYIDRVQTLPPAPVILPRLLHQLSLPDADSESIVNLISSDPSLTAAVLRLCNSATLGYSSSVSDLFEAVIRVGFGAVYELVVAIIGARTLKATPKGYGIDEGGLWKHSVATALAAKSMARDAGADEGVVFTAAILHDIGKIVLAQALEGSYQRLTREIEINQASLLESEAQILGVQHAEIGGRLLARWNFPADLVASVWNHHDPVKAIGHERLASFVYLGDLIAHFMGFGYGHHALALRGRADALQLVGLNPVDLPRYMIATYDNLDTLQAFVSIQT